MIIKEQKIDDFFSVPFNVYQGTEYISPFKADIKRFLSKDNPLFKHFGELTYYVAYNAQGVPVGRVTAHIHHKSNELHKWKRGFFGYFDCENNLETAKALLSKVEEYHRSRGMNEVMGNFNLTAMQQMGVMTGGFEKTPFIDQLYTPSFIHELLEKCGYSKTFPVQTYSFDLVNNSFEWAQDERLSTLYKNPDYRWATLEKNKLKEQLQFACNLLNDGFKNNPMFVPLTFEEFWFQAKDMSMIIDEEITSFVYYKGQPAGVVLVIPDLNPVLKEVGSKLTLSLPFKLWKMKKNPYRCLLIYASVKPEFHAHGLGMAMVGNALQKMKAKGYKEMGVTWISEENKAPLAMVKKAGAKPYHQAHLYKKDL
jgi:GNAT superfamily N-acetyltransferase/uncharacterized protein YbaA (DUF1428 family)